MSRIGKRSVAIPSGVTANINGNTLSVKGPKGSLEMGLSELIEYKLEDGSIAVNPVNDTKPARSHWGVVPKGHPADLSLATSGMMLYSAYFLAISIKRPFTLTPQRN